MKHLILPTLLAVAPLVLADEIHMLDGTVYKNCTIEVETDQKVTFIVPITKSIKDSKTVNRDQILKIVKSTPDEVEFNKLANKYDEKALADMSLDDLKTGKEKIEKLLKTYPKSNKKADIEKLQAKVADQLKKQEDAAAKAAAEAEANKPTEEEMRRFRYDIEADDLLNKMNSYVKANDPFMAMRTFDTLKKNYSGSKAYANAYPLAQKLTTQLKAHLTKRLEIAKKKEKDKEEKNRLALSQARKIKDAEQREAYEKKRRNEAAQEQQLRTQYREATQKLREKQIRWFEPIDYVPALEDLLQVATTDAETLSNPIAQDAGKATEAFKKAWALIDEKKYDEASNELSIIRSVRMDKAYFEELSNAIVEGKQKEREERAKEREKEREKRAIERLKQREARRQERLQKGKQQNKLNDLKDRLSPSSKDDKKE